MESSPRRKKPKKAVQQMAQIKGPYARHSNSPLTLHKSCAVTGNLTWDGCWWPSLERLMPAWTRFKIGRDDCSLGSGRSNDSCVLRTAARYDFMDCSERPSSVMYATKQHRRCSVTGKGSEIVYLVQNAITFS